MSKSERDEYEREYWREEGRYLRRNFPEMYLPHLCELVNNGAVVESIQVEARNCEIALLKLSLVPWGPGEWRVTPIDEGA